MTNPKYYDKPNYSDCQNYYDSQDMVSPNYGHNDCTILYPLHNLNGKHRARTLPNYNKLYASLLIVPYCEFFFIVKS